MWIVELAFTDSAERLAERPAHRERLAALHADGIVRMAGPFAGDDGAMIIVDVPDRQGVDDLIAADPYFRAPGVTVSAIRDWVPFLS
jgi:uncharacterized protein YciI